GLDPMLAPGTTPLIRAAKAMDVESMRALLEHGADISLTTNRNMTATLAASGMDSTDADTRGYFTTTDVEERDIADLELMFSHGGDHPEDLETIQRLPEHRHSDRRQQQDHGDRVEDADGSQLRVPHHEHPAERGRGVEREPEIEPPGPERPLACAGELEKVVTH